MTDAFPWDEAPRHLIRDRDGAFGPAYTRRVREMGIRDHPTAPRSPWQKGHGERFKRTEHGAALERDLAGTTGVILQVYGCEKIISICGREGR